MSIRKEEKSIEHPFETARRLEARARHSRQVGQRQAVDRQKVLRIEQRRHALEFAEVAEYARDVAEMAVDAGIEYSLHPGKPEQWIVAKALGFKPQTIEGWVIGQVEYEDTLPPSGSYRFESFTSYYYPFYLHRSGGLFSAVDHDAQSFEELTAERTFHRANTPNPEDINNALANFVLKNGILKQ